MNEWVTAMIGTIVYNDFPILLEIMIPYSSNSNNNNINLVNFNNVNNTLNANLSDDANEESHKSYLAIGLKSPPSTSGNLAFARCLQQDKEYRTKLKPPPPPTRDFDLAFCLNEEKETLEPPPLPYGDFNIAFCLNKEDEALEESIWKKAPSFKNPFFLKESQLTQFYLKQ